MSSSTTVDQPSDLLPLVGQKLGESEWLVVTQDDVNQFAQATHDEQWIHVDIERAKAGPFGTTIAHGFLTLSLLVPLAKDVVKVTKVGMGVNYGLNKVRFPAPVPVGSRVRLTVVLNEATELPGGGVQVVYGCTVEREGGDKPVLVAEWVTRQFPAS